MGLGLETDFLVMDGGIPVELWALYELKATDRLGQLHKRPALFADIGLYFDYASVGNGNGGRLSRGTCSRWSTPLAEWMRIGTAVVTTFGQKIAVGICVSSESTEPTGQWLIQISSAGSSLVHRRLTQLRVTLNLDAIDSLVGIGDGSVVLADHER